MFEPGIVPFGGWNIKKKKLYFCYPKYCFVEIYNKVKVKDKKFKTCIVFKVWKISCVLDTISWTVSWPILHKLAVLISLEAWVVCGAESFGIPELPLIVGPLVLDWELFMESPAPPFPPPVGPWPPDWEVTGTELEVT